MGRLKADALMGFGAAATGKRFRIYTICSVILFIVFGILIGREAPAISTNQATPMIGVWERIDIGVFLLWSMILGTILLRRKESKGVTAIYLNNQGRRQIVARKQLSELEHTM